jgi:hypothetical protein
MARPFDFQKPARDGAGFRQGWVCALCGENVVTSNEIDRAHHVIPNQCGRRGDPEPFRDFLRSEDNCVVLCEGCHLEAHSGNTRTGTLIGPSEFRYSHGKQGQARHATWARAVDRWWDRLAAWRGGAVPPVLP